MGKEAFTNPGETQKNPFNNLLERVIDKATIGYNLVRYNEAGVHLLHSLPTDLIPIIKRIIFEASSQLNYGRGDMPQVIGIETNSVCNRRCSYCPVYFDSFYRSREEKQMPDSVFRATIDQLAETQRRNRTKNGFCGNLQLSLYGEPLLDPKIVSRTQYAKELLPDARITMFSNGDFLEENLLKDLVSAGIDVVELTPHDGQFSEKILELAGNSELGSHLTLKKPLSLFVNRAGLITNIPQDRLLRPINKCVSATYSFAVTTDGTMMMCCHDATVEHPLGDVAQRSIWEIWDGEEYTTLRQALRNGDWENTPPICHRCRNVYI